MQNPSPNPSGPVSRIILSEYVNTLFIQIMAQSGGIYDQVQNNVGASTTVPNDANQIVQFLNQSVPVDAQEIYHQFPHGQSDVLKVLSQMVNYAGSPQQIYNEVLTQIKQNTQCRDAGLAADMLTDPLLLICPSYVWIQINDNINNYHVAYDPINVKTGRSYSQNPTSGPCVDPSDMEYLMQLNQLNIADLGCVLGNYSSFLVSSDGTKLGQYQIDGYFTAVYTAELIRYAMQHYSSNNVWATDLAQVSFLAAYINASGYLILNGQFQPGKVTDYGSRGSIGDFRSDILALSEQITEYLLANFPELVDQIVGIIGKPGTSDILGNVLYFLAQPTSSLTSEQQSTLIQLMNQYVTTLSTNSQAITAHIQNNGRANPAVSSDLI